MNDTLTKQIEAAFQYRGNVTVLFKDGKSVEGYLYNREYTNPKIAEDNFIEVFLKGSGDSSRYRIDSLNSVTLTGADEAEGKSYQDWMKKQERKKSEGGHG